jgi:anti-sigma factor RsiW
MLSKYADGEISVAERAAVDQHLRTCADCRALLDSFRKTNTLLDDALYSRSFGSEIANAVSCPRCAAMPRECLPRSDFW